MCNVRSTLSPSLAAFCFFSPMLLLYSLICFFQPTDNIQSICKPKSTTTKSFYLMYKCFNMILFINSRRKICGCVWVCCLIFNFETLCVCVCVCMCVYLFFFVVVFFSPVVTNEVIPIALPCLPYLFFFLFLVLSLWHVLRKGNHRRDWNGLVMFLLTFHR